MTLIEHIDASGERRAVWARRIGISQAYLSDLLSEKKRPSLQLAVQIERLTDGAVPASSWVAAAPPPPTEKDVA